MNDKFTPGPWGVEYGEAVRVKAKNGTVAIATNLKKGGRRDANEVEANARLIAAAPDMFAALEFAERRSRQPEEGHTEYYERIAEEFFAQHGYLAPGKDDPVQSVPPEQRREAWEKFLSEPAEARRAALAKARGQITKTKDAMEGRQ